MIKCKCDYCMFGEEADKHTHEMMDQYGWIVHLITNAKNHYKYDAHTHGLSDNFNHLDLQVVYPLPQDVLYSIILPIIRDIRAGKVFAENLIFRGYLKGEMPLTFHKTIETDREVLRLILPDKNANLFIDDIDPLFKPQWII